MTPSFPDGLSYRPSSRPFDHRDPRSRPLKTQPDVLATFSRALRTATTPDAVQREASRLPQALLATGAYRSVRLGSAPAGTLARGTAEADTAARAGADTDLLVELDETGGFAVNTGVNRTSSGNIEAVRGLPCGLRYATCGCLRWRVAALVTHRPSQPPRHPHVSIRSSPR
jgi:hypothetical protein